MAELIDENEADDPNGLKFKVKRGGPFAVTGAVLNKAQKSIDELSDQFAQQLAVDIADMVALHGQLLGDDCDPSEYLKQLFHIAHNLKGNGGTFGFDLVTNITYLLCRFIERLDVPLPTLSTEVIYLHINALKAVQAQNLTGDGGKVGISLLDGLEQVIQKWGESH